MYQVSCLNLQKHGLATFLLLRNGTKSAVHCVRYYLSGYCACAEVVSQSSAYKNVISLIIRVYVPSGMLVSRK